MFSDVWGLPKSSLSIPPPILWMRKLRPREARRLSYGPNGRNDSVGTESRPPRPTHLSYLHKTPPPGHLGGKTHALGLIPTATLPTFHSPFFLGSLTGLWVWKPQVSALREAIRWEKPPVKKRFIWNLEWVGGRARRQELHREAKGLFSSSGAIEGSFHCQALFWFVYLF